MVKHIGIVLFPEVEELDAIGPWEMLSAWTHYFPEDGYTVSCLSRSGGLVQCAKGLVVHSQCSFADAPPFEVLLYPGGQGTRPQLHDDAQLEWVRRQRAVVPLMTSVCTGSPQTASPTSFTDGKSNRWISNRSPIESSPRAYRPLPGRPATTTSHAPRDSAHGPGVSNLNIRDDSFLVLNPLACGWLPGCSLASAHDVSPLAWSWVIFTPGVMGRIGCIVGFHAHG